MFQFAMLLVQLVAVSITFFCVGYMVRVAKEMNRMRAELRERYAQQFNCN